MKPEILWSGKMPLDKIIWTHTEKEPDIFSQEFLTASQKFWKEKQTEIPSLYDGNLVLLDKYLLQGEVLSLHTKMIKFSKILYSVQNNISLPSTLGSLGFQTFIWRQQQNQRKILVGERSSSSEYMPGFLTVPGGMFESFDTQASLEKAVMRELGEEIDLELNSQDLNLIAILREQHSLGTILLLETFVISETLDHISGNEEWERNVLSWVPLKELYNHNKAILMEGLLYLSQECLY
ncbi:MAG: NUDIX hydrolase [Candidatus Hodarchaeales archaeon]